MRKYQTFWKRLAAALIDSALFVPYIFLDSTHKYFYYSIELSFILIWTAYSVYCHGRYGQTIGKRLVGIAVVDVNETSLLGYKRAFFREALWFFVSLALLLYSISQSGEGQRLVEEDIIRYDFLISLVSISWIVAELLTMLFNEKRRAVHDFIAQSVVVDIRVSADDVTATHSPLG